MTHPHSHANVPSAQPLAGLRIVDLSQGIAGPSAAMYCAKWGADVIKIEPLSGDWIRGLGSTNGNFSASAFAYNAGKRSLAIDLKHAHAGRVMQRLFVQADAVVESFRPSVAERLNVGFEQVKALQPHIVYLSVSGFGSSGPLSQWPGTDTVAQAFSGFMSLNRGNDDAPHKVDSTIMDAITGLYSYQALSMHLLSPGAGRTGSNEACYLDMSLMESAAAILAPNIIEWSMTNGAPSILNAPAGSYRTADGWIAITLVKDAHFCALAKALDREDLAEDERFLSFELRAENLLSLKAIIDEIVLQQSTEYWQKRFRDFDVLSSVIQDIGAWLENEQVLDRDMAPMTKVAEGIELRIPRLPGQAVDSVDQWQSPEIGEHSHGVLIEAGFSEAEIETLKLDGCIKQ